MRMQLPQKSRVIICPNPKCHREIEEPILLNNLSKTPAEEYYACPRCLIKLDMDAENEEDVIEESAPIHPSLEKVLDVISTKPQKERKGVEGREEAPVKPSKVEEKDPKGGESPKGCSHHFGYLAHRPKDVSIPQECLTCPKVVECMLSASSNKIVSAPLKTETKQKVEGGVRGEGDTGSQDLLVDSLKGFFASDVQIDGEILERWSHLFEGGKIVEVVISASEKNTLCRVKGVRDPELRGKGIIKMPNKIRKSLKVEKGNFVKVIPVTAFKGGYFLVNKQVANRYKPQPSTRGDRES